MSAPLLWTTGTPIAPATYRWRPTLLVLGASIAIALATFHNTIARMVSTWGYGSYSHGALVVPAALFFAWERRHLISEITPQPSLKGLVALCVSLAAAIVGVAAIATVIQQFAVVAVVISLVWSLLGDRVCRRLLFPLLVLFFAVPVGDGLLPYLQDWTAYFLTNALEWSGVPFIRDGYHLQLASGSWEVAEACSGYRYLISTIALSFVYAEGVYSSMRKRVLFMIASIVVPLLANGIRAYLIVMIGHLTNRKLAVGIDHLIYGWIFFLFVVGVMFAVGLRWRDHDSIGGLTQKAAFAAPSRSSWLRLPAASIATSTLLVASLLLVNMVPRHVAATTPPSAIAPPNSSWIAKDSNLLWQPQLRSVDAEQQLSFISGVDRVDEYVGTYLYQRSGAQLISADNLLFPDVRSRVLSQDVITAPSGAKINEAQLDIGSSRVLLWYGYVVDGRVIAHPAFAKALQAKVRLLGGVEQAQIIGISTPINGDLADARNRLLRFCSESRLFTPSQQRKL